MAALSSFTSSVEHSKGSEGGLGCLGSNSGFTTTQMGGSGKIPQPLKSSSFLSCKSGIMTMQTSCQEKTKSFHKAFSTVPGTWSGVSKRKLSFSSLDIKCLSPPQECCLKSSTSCRVLFPSSHLNQHWSVKNKSISGLRL